MQIVRSHNAKHIHPMKGFCKPPDWGIFECHVIEARYHFILAQGLGRWMRPDLISFDVMLLCAWIWHYSRVIPEWCWLVLLCVRRKVKGHVTGASAYGIRNLAWSFFTKILIFSSPLLQRSLASSLTYCLIEHPSFHLSDHLWALGLMALQG